jgi:uncharacterized protein YegP (UPF0339 family)
VAGYFTFHKTPAGQFMFNLNAGDHQVILTSQIYTTKQAALDGIESVRYNSQIELRFERRVAKDNSPYFVLTATNSQVIGRSEMYASNAAMENGIKSVTKNGATKVIREVDSAGATQPLRP